MGALREQIAPLEWRVTSSNSIHATTHFGVVSISHFEAHNEESATISINMPWRMFLVRSAKCLGQAKKIADSSYRDHVIQHICNFLHPKDPEEMGYLRMNLNNGEKD